MDLIDILRARTQTLREGDHSLGLRAVIQHVEVASAHLTRGRETQDETAFTDVIYRTNQAFEGSLKEAYRVLAGKDPNKLRPFDIENYLSDERVLRQRVLNQLKNYRTEWRNPSAHDYRLDFDEDEALLAIVSACAFAIVLIDQIAQKLASETARSAAASVPKIADLSGPLALLIVKILTEFAASREQIEAALAPNDMRAVLQGAELEGVIAGTLSAAIPAAKVETGVRLDHSLEADVVISHLQQQVLIEVKLYRGNQVHKARRVREAFQTVLGYMDASGIKEAVIYFHPLGKHDEMTLEERTSSLGRVFVLTPRGGD